MGGHALRVRLLPESHIRTTFQPEPTTIVAVVDAAAYDGLVFELQFDDSAVLEALTTRRTDGRPLTRTALKSVPLGELEREARRWIKRIARGLTSTVEARRIHDNEQLRNASEARAHGHEQLARDYEATVLPSSLLRDRYVATERRVSVEHERFLAELARDYEAACLAKDRSPNKTLAEKYHRSTSSISNKTTEAVELGFLVKTGGSGKAGGYATPKALSILKRKSR
jgi:hypothetical protein